MSTDFHIESSPTEATHCPYCQAKLLSEDKVVQCTHCESTYHDSCWAELDKCAMYGCESSGAAIISPFASANDQKAIENPTTTDEAFVFVKPAGGAHHNNHLTTSSNTEDETEADEAEAGENSIDDALTEDYTLIPDFSIDLADLQPQHGADFSIETSELAPALNCTYCHLAINVGEPCVACKRCNAMHHQDCWAERGRCAVYGCGHRRNSVTSSIDRYPSSRDPWQKPSADETEPIYIDLGKSLWGWFRGLFRSG